jgi:hypothetical protein
MVEGAEFRHAKGGGAFPTVRLAGLKFYKGSVSVKPPVVTCPFYPILPLWWQARL